MKIIKFADVVRRIPYAVPESAKVKTNTAAGRHKDSVRATLF